VTGGVIAINLKIDGIQFYNENLDLCDAALQAGLNCPLSVGAHTLNINQEIPDEAPPVSHRVVRSLHTTRLLMCVHSYR